MRFETTWVSVQAPQRHALVDLTELARSAVTAAAIADGFVICFVAHTTCTLLINEWEDGAHEDLGRALDRLAPPGAYYRHDDLGVRHQNLQADEPANGPAHVAQTLAGSPSQLLVVQDGMLVLGRWQRLMLLELDEPRERQVYFSAAGSPVPEPDHGRLPAVGVSYET